MILVGDVREKLRELADGSVHCVVTSPPYWGLRDYKIEGQLGLESTPDEFVASLVAVFREVRRVLRDDGTVWLNLGDSYIGGKGASGQMDPEGQALRAKSGASINQSYHQIAGAKQTRPTDDMKKMRLSGLKPKDLVGIPWRVAFALQADGWYLRQDIIWCLSGGAWVYVRTQAGDRPIMVREIARMKPNTVQLWNGSKWTRVLGISKSKRRGNELEVVLRSGERIACTPTHRFPTQRGLVDTGDLKRGDVLDSCRLPEPDTVKDCALDEDAAWLAGLYLAEGSRAGDTIQISGHIKEAARWERLQTVAKKFGGTATRTVSGNCMNVRLYGKVLNAIIDELVSGRIAKNKCLAPICWRYSNLFLRSMLDGYLSGDGGWDAKNNRWRLGFTRNYNLERDLRTLAARLGFKMTLKFATSTMGDRTFPSFRGEIRFEQSKHGNTKDQNEIVDIHKARCREIYDIGVEDEPHLFALASGVLTHNSKPNPMPESVTDRCTKSHEYIFLLSKSSHYFFDNEAIKEHATGYDGRKDTLHKGSNKYKDHEVPGQTSQSLSTKSTERWKFVDGIPMRNKRSVWTINTKPYKGAHFATFPPDLITPCILAGTSAHGCCGVCGTPYARVYQNGDTPIRATRNGMVGVIPGRDSATRMNSVDMAVIPKTTVGWEKSCECEITETVPCVVLDPFFGAGTTGLVAQRHNRQWIGVELNPEYARIAEERINNKEK